MKNKFVLIIAISLFAFSFHAEAKSLKATAEIQNSKGEKIGTATLIEKEKGVEVDLTVSSLSPGKHGMHIHEVGKCETPDFKSAGGHFNPSQKKHGLENPEGSHGGDMPNLIVDKNGNAKTKLLLSSVSLKQGSNSLLQSNGTTLVIHAKVDDEKTDPSGNSGDRIACGVIKAVSK